MKRINLFLLILILGSLWGFFEMMALPVFILCAIGLFFLVLGRSIINIPGTSILIGLIVCFYKAYSAHFFICQWAGVMALAGSFDLFVSLVFKEDWKEKFNLGLIGVLTNIAALIGFSVTVIFIFSEPYWVTGGLERVIDYTFYTVLPAALISGIITAPLGLWAGSKISEMTFPLQGKIIPGLYLLGTAFLWIAAAINKF